MLIQRTAIASTVSYLEISFKVTAYIHMSDDLMCCVAVQGLYILCASSPGHTYVINLIT